MGFTQKTLNAFEMTARPAAAEIHATRPNHRAFVAVYPPASEESARKWRVRRFEIPNHLINEYVGEEDLLDSKFLTLKNIEDVEKLLNSWGFDSSSLDAPWKCEYPL